jgi:hypothetical protein
MKTDKETTNEARTLRIQDRIANRPKWKQQRINEVIAEHNHAMRMPPPEWFQNQQWQNARLIGLEKIKSSGRFDLSDHEILNLLDRLPTGWKMDISNGVSVDTCASYLEDQIKMNDPESWEPTHEDHYE